MTPGEKNVINPPLVLPEKIYLPPLHIKLGFMKNFVKGVDKIGRGFEYFRNKFPNVSDAKIMDGVFIRSQIRELMQDKQFDEDLNETENKMHGFNLRGFSKTSEEITKQRTIRCCSGPVDFVQSYGKQYESENPISGITLGFFPRKSRRSQ